MLAQHLSDGYKYMNVKYEEDNKTLFSGGQRQNNRQWAQMGRQEIPFKHQEAILCCAGDRTLE